MDLNNPDILQEEIKHAGTKTAPVFQNLSADDEDQTPTEIPSLCMNCQKTVRIRQF